MSERPAISLGTLCLDCDDAHAMAAFYGGLLGWEVTATEPDWVLMRDPAGGVGLSFQAEPAYEPPTWPEQPETQQKMMHLDVRVVPAAGGDPCGPAGQEALEAAVAVAVAAGGRLAEHQPREDLRVVLDPAGHPLCLFLH
ncbi:VOC family protein [Nocardioides panaciterrulae]|uniref:Catechol 2,3-dioxygenase-like lactoylglutathione lyase family enzyme n=1 Tax=Nocardioides panaciterrulae TaxID=661492 RepID=A0A7Y9JB53_9ACTN|nr:catechol 2,3-dioxygenase-like lactoylglutathione lyase family enzyme [Nocardioides panaciterrulae]